MLKNIFTKKRGKKENPPHITRLAWVTKNRPEQVLESIRSFVPAVVEKGNSVCFCVYDDSDNAADTAHIKDGLLRTRKEYDIPVRLVTRKNRLEYVALMKNEARKDNIPPEVIDFALTDLHNVGQAHGVNRNTALLDNQGHIVLYNDDDVINRYTRFPDSRAGLQISSRPNPRRMQFYTGRKELLENIEPLDIDIVEVHQEYLGKSVEAVIDEARKRGITIDTTEMKDAFTDALETNDGRIIATVLGIYGENANKNSSSFLMWKANDHRFDYKNKEEYYKKLSSNECLYAPPVTTLTDKAYFTTTHYGVDERFLLPPFFPVFGGEDMIFGLLVKHIFRTYYFIYPALAVYHNRRVARSIQRADMVSIDNSFVSQFCLLLETLIRENIPRQGAPSLSEIGEKVQQFALLSDHDFSERMKVLLSGYYKRYIDFLSKLVEEHGGQPVWWADDVEAYKSNVFSEIEKSEFIIPDDIKNNCVSHRGHLWTYKEMIKKYGELCCYWSKIVGLKQEIDINSEL